MPHSRWSQVPHAAPMPPNPSARVRTCARNPNQAPAVPASAAGDDPPGLPRPIIIPRPFETANIDDCQAKIGTTE
jgi:hypothetical protein